MKKNTALSILFLLAINISIAQPAIYDVTLANFSASDCSGCNCSATGEWYLGSSLTLNWTDTSSLTPSLVTLEFFEVSNDAIATIPILLNSISDSGYIGLNSCVETVISIPLTPTNYNSGALNTIEIDYNSGLGILELDENVAWGTGVYARILVEYPTAPTSLADDEPGYSIVVNHLSEIQPFPNPSNGLFVFETNTVRSITINVEDQFGRKISHQEITGQRFEIDLTKEAQGVYFLQITDGETQITKRILIEK